VPDSITYHLADVYLEELEKAIVSQEAGGEVSLPCAPALAHGADTAAQTAPTPLLDLLQPWVVTVASAHSGPMYTRIMDTVLHPLLRDLLVDPPAEDEDEADAAAELSFPRLLATAAAPPAAELGDEEYDDAARKSGRRAQLRLALFRRLFAEASRPEALQARRHNLYKLWEAERARMDDAEDSE
jgi:ribosomal RNA-processing protein 1